MKQNKDNLYLPLTGKMYDVISKKNNLPTFLLFPFSVHKILDLSNRISNNH